jgi:hypothetical protein
MNISSVIGVAGLKLFKNEQDYSPYLVSNSCVCISNVSFILGSPISFIPHSSIHSPSNLWDGLVQEELRLYWMLVTIDSIQGLERHVQTLSGDVNEVHCDFTREYFSIMLVSVMR